MVTTAAEYGVECEGGTQDSLRSLARQAAEGALDGTPHGIIR
jgi:hypothetical protein